MLILDIGGEGRHGLAWNVNPSRTKTLGPRRGESIPRHVDGRANAIPFPDASASLIIVERTPLLRDGLREIRRVIAPGGLIVLRHVISPIHGTHIAAKQILPGTCHQQRTTLDGAVIQETRFLVPHDPLTCEMDLTRARHSV